MLRVDAIPGLKRGAKADVARSDARTTGGAGGEAGLAPADGLRTGAGGYGCGESRRASAGTPYEAAKASCRSEQR